MSSSMDNQTTSVPYLLGELKGMVGQVLINQKEDRESIRVLEDDVAQLKQSRAKMVGWVGAISAGISAAFTLGIAWFTGGK